MESLFDVSRYGDWALLLLRVALGAIFLSHGTQKWAMWKMQSSPQMSQGMLNLMRFLSIVEPLGGIAVLSGFLAQFAAAGFMAIMLGAIFFKARVWQKKFSGEGGWEFDFLILVSALVLLFFGPGNITLSGMFWGW